MFYIYLTTNLVNGKKYIGQHKGELNDSYLGSSLHLLNAINKYGKENFKKEILEICNSKEELDEREKYYIALYNAVEDENYYNRSEGGTGGDGWKACKKWVQENPEEAQKIYQKNYQRLVKWRQENPKEYREKVIKPLVENGKKYWEEHPEERKELMKKVNLKKEEWQKLHQEEHQKQIDEWRKKGSITNSKKVRCINTGEIFESLSAAARAYNVAQPNIGRVLSGERKSAGRHPITNEKLKWERVDE